jgi:ATP-dependent 26S proteasome regulatory subunit
MIAQGLRVMAAILRSAFKVVYDAAIGLVGWIVLDPPESPSTWQLAEFHDAVVRLSSGHTEQQSTLRAIYIAFSVIGVLAIGHSNPPPLLVQSWFLGMALLIFIRILRSVAYRITISKLAFGGGAVQGAHLKGLLMAALIAAPIAYFGCLLGTPHPKIPLWLGYTAVPLLMLFLVLPIQGNYKLERAHDCATNRAWWRTVLFGAPVLAKQGNAQPMTQSKVPLSPTQSRAVLRQEPIPQQQETNRRVVSLEEEMQQRVTGPPPKPLIRSEKLTWNDLILSEKTLKQIQITLEVLKDPKKRRLVVSPPRGMLLYGPPGTGKTQVARVIASVGQFNFYTLSSAEARGAFIGHGAARIKQIFETARNNLPAIIFIDELDAIAANRQEISAGSGSGMFTDTVNELLQQMDGMDERRVFVIGATNLPERIDPAMLRRLGVDPTTYRWAIEIPLPDEQCRAKLLRLYTQKMLVEQGLDITSIVRLSEGLSGDGLQELCNQAGLQAIHQGHERVMTEDFLAAISHGEPRRA